MSLFSSVLDTLIAIVAIYGGLAVLCSFVNEAIAALTQLRGRHLYWGLISLVFDWKEIVADIYAHPLVSAGTLDTNGRAKPSYLDARTFSTAFWQCLQTKLGGSDQQTAAALAGSPQQLLSDLQSRVSSIDPETPGLGPLKNTLGQMLAQASGDYEKLLSLTDTWFNNQMDRVAGWYRRNTQWILLGLGFVIAFAFNIDTIHIVKYLNTSPEIRTRIASNIAEKISPAAPASPAPNPSASPDAAKLANQASALDQALIASEVKLDDFITINPKQGFTSSFKSGDAFVGTLITAFALALGAPFWFDLLSNLVNVRMAGNKPDNPQGRSGSS